MKTIVKLGVLLWLSGWLLLIGFLIERGLYYGLLFLFSMAKDNPFIAIIAPIAWIIILGSGVMLRIGQKKSRYMIVSVLFALSIIAPFILSLADININMRSGRVLDVFIFIAIGLVLFQLLLLSIIVGRVISALSEKLKKIAGSKQIFFVVQVLLYGALSFIWLGISTDMDSEMMKIAAIKNAKIAKTIAILASLFMLSYAKGFFEVTGNFILNRYKGSNKTDK